MLDNDNYEGVKLNHFLRISPPARIVDLSMRVRNDVNCRTWDYQYNQATKLSEPGLERLKGGSLDTSTTRVLVVEDSEPFRKFICSTLRKRLELQIVGVVTDGLQAVQKAGELQPDVIVIDIGLPSLNGIEAARQIRKLSPESKLLFVSQESSIDVVREALGTGAHGYIVKTDAGRELEEGVNAVLLGKLFVGRRFSGHHFDDASHAGVSQDLQSSNSCAQLQQ